VIGPFSKLDIFKMSIFRKPLPLFFWTFSYIFKELKFKNTHNIYNMAGKKRSGLAYHRRAYTYSTTTYTVTYDGNTNTSGNTPVNGSSSYASGSTITILGNSGSPVLAKTGFTFAGWNTSANGSGTSYSQGNTFTINNNITLYAQWTAVISLSAPTALSSVGGNQAAYILFTQSGTVTNYEYSTDDGATFLAFNPPQIYSPVNITTLSVDGTTPLENETTYTVKLRAVNSGTSSSDSVSVDVVPTTTSLLTTARIIYLDANNSSSYPGSGTTWTNLDSLGSYSATLNGSPTFDETNSGNKYFEFNTGVLTGQYAQINQAAAINPLVNEPFTIQIWAKINNIGSQGTLVSKMYDQSRDYDGYNFIYKNDSALQLHLNGSSRDNRFISTTGVLSSGWALYTANIQFGNGGGRTNKIFVNGRQVLANTTSTEGNIPSNNQVLTIAAGFGGDGECDVGQFYYYDSELTQTQIIQNFDATKSRYI
jgi:uncharacterized repeat protein (TIGR02543 family)